MTGLNDPQKLAGRLLPRWAWSTAAVGFWLASHAGLAQEKPGARLAPGTSRPSPQKPVTETPEPPRDPNALKPYQVLSTGSPPASPAEFSPDFGARMFDSLLSPAPASASQFNVRAHFSPLRPDFNPDPNAAQPLVPWRSESDELRFRTRHSEGAPPQMPAQFNPDPGAWKTNAPPAREKFFQNEPDFSRQPYGSGKLPDVVALPRARVRANQWTSEPAPPRAASAARDLPPPPPRVRGTLLTLAPAASSQSGYGRDPLPADLALPRPDTRRNLRIADQLHPHDPPDAGDYRATADSEPRPDRWRIPFAHWKRYPFSDVESPYYYEQPAWWHPYRQSVLKGDVPIIGRDIFLNLTASSSTEYEGKTLPTPSGISASQAGAAEFFGKSEIQSIQQNFAFSVELFKGETAFKPVEWAVRLTPVYNVNYVQARETGVVSPDPRGALGGGSNATPPSNGGVQNPGDLDTLLNGQLSNGPANLIGKRSTTRTKDFLSLQEWFAEVHLRDLSDNYDFLAMRAGNQTFNSDFRGFLFNDTNLGLRLFGNAQNNKWQYNFAAFDLREKDTNSELNTFDARNQQVLILNAYRQDFLFPGYTATWSVHFNNDEATTHYDRNGNIARPAPIGAVRAHEVQAVYLGWGGDGHLGPVNVSHQFYQALGHDSFNGVAGRPVDINAQMAALELSYDRDWLRYKASVFWASGDDNANDSHARGFDTIIDNPNFFGGPFSYWVRQGFNLAGTAVGLKQRGSLVPNLRTSKFEGQSNFVNPGVQMFGVGLDADITPKLKGFFNANYVRFDNTDVIKTVLLTDKVDNEIGYDLSLGFQYRPFLTDNIIVTTGFGALIPGRGYRDIYKTSTDPVTGLAAPAGKVDGFLYSGLIAITLTY